MIKRFILILAVWLVSSSAYASCVLEAETDEKNFTRCLQQAGKDDAKAQAALALMFYEGKGVAQNYDKAVQWYLKSAKQGNTLAQASLGMAYARGVGIPKDQITALMWMNIADANGLESIVLYRTTLMSLMTADQKEQAHRLAVDWLEKH
ncbi:tetratricopeptide repeat protein [Pseudomonadota bacterium]